MVLTAEQSLNRKVFGWCRNKSMDDAEVTLSGSAFEISAVATIKGRLPIVDSLKIGKKQKCSCSGRSKCAPT